MNKIYRNIIAYTMASFMVMPVFALALTANAQTPVDPWGGTKANVQSGTGLGNRDPRDIAASIVRVLLGFLGIIAVVIIIFGGFKWMTAAGAEDKVEEAKKLITAGVIGLVIILAAFGISSFVIDSVMNATQ
jgi:hypothetical protein